MIDLYQQKLNELRSTLTHKQLKSIHFESVNNFLNHFSSFESEQIQNKVLEGLAAYFNALEENDFDFTEHPNRELYDYIRTIGAYYNYHLNFKVYMQEKWALFIGVHIDLVLLFFGVLQKLYYLPITTIVFVGYMFYLRVLYRRRGKLYGLGI